MPYLRYSRARYVYQCRNCSAVIRKRESYFRDEPHPFARMRGEAVTEHLCLVCVLGERGAAEFINAISTPGQLPLGFELTRNGFLRFPPRVELVNLTPAVIRMLGEDPERLRELNPDTFERLICDRLDHLGFELERVGRGTHSRDGGVDIVAWPKSAPIPYLVAVQAKHTASGNQKVGPAPVRELLGAVEAHGFNAGLLVTNTSFTPDARWAAERRALLVQLRDIHDLREWLVEETLGERKWNPIPVKLELCPGVSIQIPR